jgi:segregation and condensation protein B
MKTKTSRFYYSMSEISYTDLSLESCLEALLFVAAEPVSIGQLGEASGAKNTEVEEALKNLETRLTADSGLRLQRHAGKVQLTTAPELSIAIENFLGLEATARLSRAALEALAIVAYRQPITRPTIDAVRGVNSDGVIKSLLAKNLIQEAGRTEGPGRPILYGTTNDFLQHFGLSSLEQLPPFEREAEAEVEENDDRLLKD